MIQAFKKKISVIGLFSLLFIFTILVVSCNKQNNQTHTNPNLDEKQEVKTESDDTLYAVIGVGDIMMGSNYPTTYALPPNDGEDLFEDVKDILQSADITFGNLEGPLLNSGGIPKKYKDTLSTPICFRMPEHYASYLKDAGFTIVSVANNHSGDMGELGRTTTLKTLDEYGIKYAGYTTCPYTIIVKDGIKFGFTAFAPNKGTNDLNDPDAAEKLISEVKKKCDILIVSFHGGAEGTSSQHVTGSREFFLGEDRGNVYEFAHSIIDAGADIVFGQGPHVTRALELYKDRIIAYSLGNFCTYGKFGLSGALGVAPILKVYVDKDGKFVKGRIYPIKQVKRGIPMFDESYKIVSIISKLMEQDFPNSPLTIDEDGKIEVEE